MRDPDWQLAQTAEESWRECEIHAKNLQTSGLSSSAPAATATGDGGESAEPVEAATRARGKRTTETEGGLFSVDDDDERA